jgi:hypothetical protein
MELLLEVDAMTVAAGGPSGYPPLLHHLAGLNCGHMDRVIQLSVAARVQPVSLDRS